MYFQIYSHCLDYDKNWYAYQDLLFGYPKSNRRHEGSAVFQLFPSNVQKVNIADIQDCSDEQPSYRWFNGRGQKAKEVYATRSFGIFLLVMRQRNPKDKWLKSSAYYKSINKIVNTVCLQKFSEDDSEATSGNCEPSPKCIHMERQICLQEKNEQQETVILSERTHK